MNHLKPAFVCRIYTNIIRMRKMCDNDPELKSKIGHLVDRLPFEKELMSGDTEKVHKILDT